MMRDMTQRAGNLDFRVTRYIVPLQEVSFDIHIGFCLIRFCRSYIIADIINRKFIVTCVYDNHVSASVLLLCSSLVTSNLTWLFPWPHYIAGVVERKAYLLVVYLATYTR